MSLTHRIIIEFSMFLNLLKFRFITELPKNKKVAKLFVLRGP